MEARTSSWEMFFGNVLDQLSSAALLDVSTLESIAADVDAKVESLQESVANSASGIKLLASCSNQEASDSHCQSDLLALNCFLTNVVQALECNQGLEDSILKELLSFCSRNGFMLPPVSSEIEHNDMGSSASLNTVSAIEEETKYVLWNRIKSKVKIGISNKLQQSVILNRSDYEQPGYQKEIARRVQLIELLMVLFPIYDILDFYAKTRLNKLEQVLVGTKKHSVSWADETDVEQVKLLENLEVIVVNQLNMLNMDVSVLWKINEYMPQFKISDVIQKVYFPELHKIIENVVQYFEVDKDQSKASNSLLQVENFARSNRLTGMDDIRFIAKAFVIACNWENEVKEIIDLFSVKPERRYSGDGLRSVLKASSTIYPSVNTFGKLERIIWDEENDRNMRAPKTMLSKILPIEKSPKSVVASSTSVDSIEAKWQWRSDFRVLIPDLCKVVMEILYSSELLIDGIENEKEIEMIHVHECLFHEHPRYPQKLPISCAKIVSQYDEILPLASFLGGSVFEPVQSAFIDSISSSLREYHKVLTEALQVFPENPNVFRLYSLMCIAAFFQQHLEFYEENMTNLRKKPFQPVIKLFSDLLENVKSTVILYHLKIITSSLLFDAQSNKWTDNKPFFEGERYSYCVQMWSYYISCICKDIWYTLPQSKSEEILREVMTKSLVILTGRYSNLKPSFARAKQFRCDVVAICDVTSWLCWKLASLPSELFCREEDASDMRNWHSLCSSMLVNMIFVSTPLKMIADYLTNPRVVENLDQSVFEPSKLLFLWSQPYVFPKPIKCLSEMDGREAVFVIFKLIVSQSHPKWPLVCQAVLMRNALLPTLIASYADVFVQSSYTISPPEEDKLLNGNFYVSKKTESSSLGLKAFFRYVYLLLFKSSAKSDALAHFLMALANRENTWGLFDNHIVMRAKATHETPIWLQNVEQTLIPFLSRSFLPSLEMICDVDRQKSHPSFAFTNLEMLPCGCATVPEDTSSLFSSEGELLYQCLVSTLNAFTENLNTIPRIIAVFFNRLNEYLYQRHFSAATKSPGLKILAFVSYKWLTTQENICLLFDFPLSDETFTQIKCFAELVWYLLFNLTTDVSQNTLIPSDILSHIKTNKGWLQDKLKMLTNYFKASVVNSPANGIDQLPDDLAESQYLALSSTLMVLPECREALQMFYHILKDNQEKIEEKLLPSRISSFDQKVVSKATDIERRDAIFNPLKEYERFGEFVHSQEQTLEMEPNWSKWFYITDKFPIVVLRRILLGRQEFLPESYDYLTDEEKIAHEKLLRYFENYTSPFSDRPISSGSSSTRSSSVTE